MNQVSTHSPEESIPPTQELLEISRAKIAASLRTALALLEDNEVTLALLNRVKAHTQAAQRENFRARLRIIPGHKMTSVFQQVREVRA